MSVLCSQVSASFWYSWFLLWPCLWDLGSASKRLDVCTIEEDISSGSGSGSGSRSGNGTVDMPPILYFQTSTRSPNPVHMNYAWSTVGFPTLFLSQSFDSRTCNNSLTINEEEFLKSQSYRSVYIAGADGNASLAIIFRRLIQYNGGKRFKASSGFNPSMTVPDQENENETQYSSVYLNESIKWHYYDDQSIVGSSADDFNSLRFRFKLPSREEDERISYFPRTKFTQNSTVFDITIDKFNYTKTKNGRVAIEMIMVNGQMVDKSSTRMTSTQDDEYTPSVFRMWEYFFNQREAPNRAYLQWKPVSYMSKGRKSTKSQEANIVFPNGEAIDFLNGRIPRSLASALFDDSALLNGTAMYIVIGTDEDETYVNTGYQTWTAVVGFGRVPKDTLSLEVIIIISVVLGIPAILIFLGSFYVTYKEKPWQNVARGIRRLRGVDGYERLN